MILLQRFTLSWLEFLLDTKDEGDTNGEVYYGIDGWTGGVRSRRSALHIAYHTIYHIPYIV